jgi:hypothetical protein
MAASVGNRAPPHGGEGSRGVLPPFDCSLPLAADRAGVAADFVVARRREACQLAPPQHGGARSGASDDDGGNPANIAASEASNQIQREASNRIQREASNRIQREATNQIQRDARAARTT